MRIRHRCRGSARNGVTARRTEPGNRAHAFRMTCISTKQTPSNPPAPWGHKACELGLGRQVFGTMGLQNPCFASTPPPVTSNSHPSPGPPGATQGLRGPGSQFVGHKNPPGATTSPSNRVWGSHATPGDPVLQHKRSFQHKKMQLLG